MKDRIKYKTRQWRELSSILSDEKKDKGDLLGRFMADDSHNTINYWKELSKMNKDQEINVDKAWDKLYSRLNENRLIKESEPVRRRISGNTLLRIAAAALILIGIGAGLTYLGQKGILSRETIISTSENQKNLQVTLPDGSIIFLNRNTELSYSLNFGRKGREVKLSGEAFFDISHDSLNPFIVKAGSARIKVIGTSFNVISHNSESEVEVYVQTGRVMISDNSGEKNLEIDPGFVGTISKKAVNKKENENPNYMSWNTGLLI